MIITKSLEMDEHSPSWVNWENTDGIHFSRVNSKWRAKDMVVNRNHRGWRMHFVHELGHVLDQRLDLDERSRLSVSEGMLRSEVRAWRIARSFCKEKYWDNDEAIRCLESYANRLDININWDKFKIIPLIQRRKK